MKYIEITIIEIIFIFFIFNVMIQIYTIYSVGLIQKNHLRSLRVLLYGDRYIG